MKRRILVIDDEESIRELLRQFLTLKGFDVTVAATTAQALEVATTCAPDLVISDLTMEDSDGLALIDRLKELLPGVPVLLLTGVSFGSEVVRENLLARVSAYLHKTVPLQQVLAEIQRLLAGRP